MRVNVRLDESRSAKFEALKEITGASSSEVLRLAIDHYYGSLRSSGARSREVLVKTGFVGCAEGPADLSETYKRRLEKDLRVKHDHR